jgi:aminoglycoside 2''-phosphotransferase
VILDSYRQVIEKYFHHGEIRSLIPIDEGWSSFVVDINGEYIFRFPRREEIRQAQTKEIRLLPELGKVLSVSIPVFEYLINLESLPECMVGYRKIIGVPLSRNITMMPEIPRQVGMFLTELHLFPIENARQLGVPGAASSDWIEKYASYYTWVKENVFPLLGNPARNRWAHIWEYFLIDLDTIQFQPVLIHGDLAGEHILCDPDLKTLCGIIDWEDTCIGDPALDFVGLFWVGGHDFVEKVLQNYKIELGDKFWSRLDFYAKIAPFYEIQYGLYPGNEFHLKQALRTIDVGFSNDGEKYD